MSDAGAFCFYSLLSFSALHIIITYLFWVNLMERLSVVPVDTRRRFNVYKTSIRRHRRRIDVL